MHIFFRSRHYTFGGAGSEVVFPNSRRATVEGTRHKNLMLARHKTAELIRPLEGGGGVKIVQLYDHRVRGAHFGHEGVSFSVIYESYEFRVIFVGIDSYDICQFIRPVGIKIGQEVAIRILIIE